MVMGATTISGEERRFQSPKGWELVVKVTPEATRALSSIVSRADPS